MKKTKLCVVCNVEFIPRTTDVLCNNRECFLQHRRNWHKKNGDRLRANARWTYHHGRKAYYAKYEKTVSGFLMRMYRNMQSRVTGVQKAKFHLYKGKSLLDRKIFYNWAKSSKDFERLYKIWIENNYDRKLTPSVDRINPKIGYELSNMEWVTHSENSRRSSITRKQMMI